jgi:hypothetical protein
MVVAAALGGCLLLAGGGVATAAILRGAEGSPQTFKPVHVPGPGGAADANLPNGTDPAAANPDPANPDRGAGQLPTQPQDQTPATQNPPPAAGGTGPNTAGPTNQQPAAPPANPAASGGKNHSSNHQNTNPPAGGTMLTEAEARGLALAKVPGATSIKIHLEFDDGRYVYEGEIIHGYNEYDFEIDAHSGQFLEWDVDRFDD